MGSVWGITEASGTEANKQDLDNASNRRMCTTHTNKECGGGWSYPPSISLSAPLVTKIYLGSDLIGELRRVLAKDAQVSLEVLLVGLELVNALRARDGRDGEGLLI